MDMEQILGAGIVFVTGIMVKVVYDRWFSKESRVTLGEYTIHMKAIEERLRDGRQTFERINACMITMCLIIIDLCEKTGADCADLKKKMTEAGLKL